jgi:hypothetical protein
MPVAHQGHSFYLFFFFPPTFWDKAMMMRASEPGWIDGWMDGWMSRTTHLLTKLKFPHHEHHKRCTLLSGRQKLQIEEAANTGR